MSDLALDQEPRKTGGQLFDNETSARISLFPKADDIRSFHFSVQQLRILESVGLLAGLAEKAYALPLNFKTKHELDEDMRKKLEDLWRVLMNRSILLGVKIATLKDQIETTLNNLDSLIHKMENSNKDGKLDEKIDDLKEDRNDLHNKLKKLDEIENERMQATPETIDEVETRYEGYEHSLMRFFRRLRKRTRSHTFGHEADGVDITSAHTARRSGRTNDDEKPPEPTTRRTSANEPDAEP